MQMASSQFTESEIAQIKRWLSRGEKTPRQIATEYECALETIRKIARGDTFHWIPAEAPKTDSLVEQIPEPLTDEAQESMKRMLAFQESLQAKQANLPDYLKPSEASTEAPVRYVPPVKSELSESDAAELVAKRSQSDQQLIARFAEATGIPLEEIQKRYLSLKGDRQAIGKLFNDLAHAPKREFVTLKETLDD